MAFCSNCGAQLESGARFCVQCGANQMAKAAGAPAAPAAAPPAGTAPQAAPFQAAAPTAVPQHAIPPIPGLPQYPLPPGQIPIVMAGPQMAPQKSRNTLLWVAVVCAVLYGLYYIGSHNQNRQTQTGPDPKQQSGQDQAILQAQQFTGNYDSVNGYIQISQGIWRNGSNVALQSAKLQCAQISASGQSLTQNQTTLNGPAGPGQTISFPSFQIGTEAQGVSKVNCNIVEVDTAN